MRDQVQGARLHRIVVPTLFAMYFQDDTHHPNRGRDA
jgi:hypothetical protein